MNPIFCLIYLVVGMLLVIKGGDWFVDSSVSIARAARIPRVIIGGTLVSFATTMPELVVSSTASWMGDSGIALGNAVGSVIANIGLIVGVAGLLTRIKIHSKIFIERAVWMLALGVLIVVLTAGRHLGRPVGLGLLVLGLVYLGADLMFRKKSTGEDEETEKESNLPLGRAVMLFISGAVLVVLGSRFLVTGGTGIAAALGIPSILIGLTVVAVGTSLPELVTAIVAARKGVADLSVGNILGANVLNLTLITGTAGTIRPLEMSRFTQLYSLPAMILFMVLMVLPFGLRGVLEKREAIRLLILYAVYVAGLALAPLLELS